MGGIIEIEAGRFEDELCVAVAVGSEADKAAAKFRRVGACSRVGPATD